MRQSQNIHDIPPGERKLLSQLKKRPEFFLGEASLEKFRHMVTGYFWATQIMSTEETHRLLPDGLAEFTAKYFGMGWPVSYYDYAGMILLHEPDDGKALDLFFKILDKYLCTLGYEPIPVWDEPFTSIK